MPAPKDFEKMFREMQKRMDALEQRQHRSLSGTGMSVPAVDVTQVDGSLVVQSGEAKSGNFAAGSTGWHLDSGGNAEFNDLTLRGGIIGNDALTSPTSPQVIYASTTNFSVSTTNANKLTATLTVPAGFTKLACTVTARVFVYNPNTTGGYNGAGGDYLYGQANIAGYNGYALPLPVSGSNGSGTNVSTFSVVLTGLTPGSSVLVQASAQTSFATIAADPGNTAELSGLATWYR